MKGNTVGSRSNIVNLAYIAGFLDGDGSLMFQVKKRSDIKKGWRLMATICFYQDSRHDKPLSWIRNQLGIGYISRRNDNITELRINGFNQVRKILEKLLPYLRFKKHQARILIDCLKYLKANADKLDQQSYKKIIEYLLSIQNLNYQSPHKKTREDFMKIFGLTP